MTEPTSEVNPPTSFRDAIEGELRSFAVAYHNLQITHGDQQKPTFQRDAYIDTFEIIKQAEAADTAVELCHHFSRYRDAGGSFEEFVFDQDNQPPFGIKTMLQASCRLEKTRLAKLHGLTRSELRSAHKQIVRAHYGISHLDPIGLIQWGEATDQREEVQPAIVPPVSLRDLRHFLYCLLGHVGVIPFDEYMDHMVVRMYGGITGMQPRHAKEGIAFRISPNSPDTPALHEPSTPTLCFVDSPVSKDLFRVFVQNDQSAPCPFDVGELASSGMQDMASVEPYQQVH
ncbi:hypothetical protein VRRI112168_03395 [Vreelandella rituensis]|uniref:Uncharacterized protein n=1 Tax=Vreelandella rituensis TaxID=2282306 RepID=A0A368U917_9GAMM|nr:hypothetical protein [Halomonas rituensis]RCV93698.1 hypothetical protein DU506_00665 [Halomonas rituensis]